MERMKHELRCYLEKRNAELPGGRGASNEIIKDAFLNRNYINDALNSKNDWTMERAETLDPYANFSDEAWEEAYQKWGGSGSLTPFNRKMQVSLFVSNQPVYNWRAA